MKNDQAKKSQMYANIKVEEKRRVIFLGHSVLLTRCRV